MVSTIAQAVQMAPPEPHLRKTAAAWVGFMLMFLFFGVVIAISLMSSKRGHQD
jgi:cytochrome b561